MQVSTLFATILATATSIHAQSSFGSSSSTPVTVVSSANPIGSTTPTTPGSIVPSMVVSSVSQSTPLPSGVAAIITISTGNGGSFTCGTTGITFNPNGLSTSGSLFSQMTDGTLSCNGAKIFISITQPSLAKRQTVSPVYTLGLTQAGVDPTGNAGFAIPTFTVTGTTLNMFSAGISFGFGFVSGSSTLSAYNLALTVPANFQVVVLTATVITGTPLAVLPVSPTTTTTAVATVTSAVVQIINNVSVNVNIVVIVTPLAVPVLVQQTIAIEIGGVTYYVAQNIGLQTATQYVSINGVAVSTALTIIVIQVVPVVVPVIQISVNGTGNGTISGVVTTIGTIVTTRNAGGASTTTITLAPTAVVTATSQVTIVGAAGVVVNAAASASVVAGAGVPIVTKLPSANSAGSLGASMLFLIAPLLAAFVI